MGTQSQVLFIEEHREKLLEPVLEVGSRDYGTTPNYRRIFGLRDYTGIDLSLGSGVDVVVDLSASADAVTGLLGDRRFRTVICMSVLEHCARPFQMAENIQRLMMPGAHLFVSVPFAWRVHGYPDDFWRFTPRGVQQLFPEIDFLPPQLSTSEDGDRAMWDDYARRIELRGRVGMERGLYGFTTAALISLLRRARGLSYLTRALRYPYLLPPVHVDMIGQRRPGQ